MLLTARVEPALLVVGAPAFDGLVVPRPAGWLVGGVRSFRTDVWLPGIAPEVAPPPSVWFVVELSVDVGGVPVGFDGVPAR